MITLIVLSVPDIVSVLQFSLYFLELSETFNCLTLQLIAVN
jgi:hypothetical protein